MLSPEQIAQTAANKYPHFLREHFAGCSIFPYHVAFGRPRGTHRLIEVAAEARALMQGSAASLGCGYTVETEVVGTRLGEQRFPVRVYFPDAANFLRYIDKEREFSAIAEDIALIEREVPAAGPWARANPLRVHSKHGLWRDLCIVIRELLAHPRPGCFPRDLPLDVSGKLLEQESGTLCDILRTIPGPHWREGGDFHAQLGLRRPPATLVRFRFLDPAARLANAFPVEELALSLDTLAARPLRVQRVFVIENLMTYLSFPALPDAVAIYGEGRAGERLGRLSWLGETELWYWGDIDSHGLEILRALRASFPRLQSMLMDVATLERFDGLLTRGHPTDTLILTGLTGGEIDAAKRVHADRTLLEQEKIPQPSVSEFLRARLLPRAAGSEPAVPEKVAGDPPLIER